MPLFDPGWDRPISPCVPRPPANLCATGVSLVQSALRSCPAGKEARRSHSRPRRRRRRSWTRRTSPSSRGRKPRRPLSRPRATRVCFLAYSPAYFLCSSASIAAKGGAPGGGIKKCVLSFFIPAVPRSMAYQ
ncbi:hypothetical protein BD311DRAFT_865092, partial [Dichomitus squalens]